MVFPLCVFSHEPWDCLGYYICIKQWSRANAFSPVWIRMCARRFGRCVNFFEHRSQDNRFTPECESRCCWSWAELTNLLGHKLHANGFSFVCLLMWILRSLLPLNLLGHRSQENGSYPVWTRMGINMSVIPVVLYWNESTQIECDQVSGECWTQTLKGEEPKGTCHFDQGHIYFISTRQNDSNILRLQMKRQLYFCSMVKRENPTGAVRFSIYCWMIRASIFITVVCSEVTREMWCLSELFGTLVTREWFFARVKSHVHQEVAGSRKFCGTFVTGVWFFLWVCSQMIF